MEMMPNNYGKCWCRKIKKWILLFSMLFLLACQKQSMPVVFIDNWITDHPKYEKCLLVIAPRHISFVDPDENVNKFAVTKVITSKKDQNIRAIVEIVNTQNDTSTIELLYSTEEGGQLSFKNQPGVVWRRHK